MIYFQLGVSATSSPTVRDSVVATSSILEQGIWRLGGNLTEQRSQLLQGTEVLLPLLSPATIMRRHSQT